MMVKRKHTETMDRIEGYSYRYPECMMFEASTFIIPSPPQNLCEFLLFPGGGENITPRPLWSEPSDFYLRQDDPPFGNAHLQMKSIFGNIQSCKLDIPAWCWYLVGLILGQTPAPLETACELKKLTLASLLFRFLPWKRKIIGTQLPLKGIC